MGAALSDLLRLWRHMTAARTPYYYSRFQEHNEAR